MTPAGRAARTFAPAAALGVALALTFTAPARAADVETRDFKVFCDGKAAGDAFMTIHQQDDGTLNMSCDTDLKVEVLGIKSYTYVYRGREVWKGGRLLKFDSTCSDDGKRYVVAAQAEKDALRIRVNNHERVARGDVWLTSYWSQPPKEAVGKTLGLIDADNGRDLEAKLAFLGVEQAKVAGKEVNVAHFKLTGKVNVDLWYDGDGRLVRQEWAEDGHKMLLDLVRLRR